jgi:poly(3-hydroxybutyrate) depolymerase
VVLNADDAGKSIELHHWTSDSDRTEVQFYKILGGGHEWPTHLGDPQRSTATIIWDFFQSHLPAGNRPAS